MTLLDEAVEANFSCGLCGAPLVVLELAPAPGDKIVARLVCPNHRLISSLTLDHAALDLWVGVAADRVFRCARCGVELDPVAGESMAHPDIAEETPGGGEPGSSFRFVTFTLTCPRHGTQDNTRKVWDVLHRRLLTEIQVRRGLELPIQELAPTTAQPSRAASSQEETQQAERGTKEEKACEPSETGRVPLYCEQCGKRIRPGDAFCFHCGAPITD